MANTGAATNVIKKKCTIGLPIRFVNAKITGINNTPINCDQECKITIDNIDLVFLIIPDNFPLDEDGISGKPQKEDAIILTKQKTIIFNRKNMKIFKIGPTYSTIRSDLLKKNTRLDHILNAKDRNDIWKIIDSFQYVYYLPGDPLPCTKG